jgi:hypothetical protein
MSNEMSNSGCSIGLPFLGVLLSDRQASAERSATLRSRITNGSKMVANVDGRSAEARRYKDLTMSLADDLGGASALTEAQRALVRQAAAMIVQSEKLQGAVLRGEIVDYEQLTRLANAATRILTRLGLKKPSPPQSVHDNIRRVFPAARLEAAE